MTGHKSNPAKLLVLLAVTAALASCVMVVRERYGSGEGAPLEEYRRSFAFDPGGIVSLQNGDGDIQISGWSEPRVEVRAWRSDTDRDRVRIYAMKDLAPEVRAGLEDGRLDIRSGEPDNDEGDGSAVDFAVNVPESVFLESIENDRGDIRISGIYGKIGIESGEGDVRIENFSGSLRAALDQGAIDTEALDLRPDDEIRITVRGGNIVLRLEASASAAIDADAPKGKISSDFNMGEDPAGTRVSFRTGGEKGATIVLEALDGDIRILKTE